MADLSVLEERQRVQSIQAMADQWDMGRPWATRLISQGASVEKARELCSAVVEQRGSGDRALGLSRKESSAFSLCKALTVPAYELDGLEKECHEAMLSRLPDSERTAVKGVLIPTYDIRAWAQSTRGIQSVGGNGGSFGGALVETQLDSANFITVLENSCRVLELGARTLAGQVGNLDIPKQTGSNTTAWISENEPLELSAMNFGLIQMRPRTVGALTSYSRQMMLSATPEIENLVRADLLRCLSIEVDRAAINGAGGLEPLGLLNQAGVTDLGSSGADGDPLSWDILTEMEAVISEQNADTGSLGFLTTARIRKAAKNTTQNSSNVTSWLWENNRMNGYPVAISENVPKGGSKGASSNLQTVIYGNWQDLLIANWGSMEILVNPFSTGFRSGSTEARVLMTCDVAIRRPESFCFSREIKPG